MGSVEEHPDIVIVGGGICGLATALALHRKGIRSLVLEKHETIRATGAAIGVFINAWRALDELGVGAELRRKSVLIPETRDVWHDKNTTRINSCRKEELRCLKRSDLLETLYNNLPVNSVRFECQIEAVGTDPLTSFPTLYTHDGNIIKPKVLIGCDGSNSTISKSLGLKTPESLTNCVIRGLTNYPNGHNFDHCLLRHLEDCMVFGRIPIDNNLVHWFIDWPYPDKEGPKDPTFIIDLAIRQIKDYPAALIEMVKNCDPASLSFTRIRYQHPWHLVLGNFCRGTITIAGDAMHVMGPFLGQGGGAALEDAVVLARNLAEMMPNGHFEANASDDELRKRIGTALKNYLKERKLRILRLTMQSMLVGLLMSSPFKVKRLASLVLLVLFFGWPSLSHTQFDCGRL